MVDQIGAAIGLSDVAFTNEEIFWATRKVLEALARDRPLLLILEDIHWAEPTFLDLVEHVADLASKVPITLLCLARPELLEVRSSWGGGKLNSATILLEPLTEKEAALLLRRLAIDIGERRVDEILRAAEGNPLFLEQLLASSNEDVSDPGLPVPPTIQALIAARIDRLGPGERAVLEGASIMGREFWQAALADLLPQEAGPPLPTHLEVLVRKQFIRPERPSSQGGPYYRFRHLLIQSTTYAAIPKKQRADLHERFAAWMERRFSGRIAEVEEILGYHLEQAYRCREQLGTLDGHTEELAVRAAERLAAGGRGGLSRGDASAAASLLGRAIRLLVDITGRLGTDAADTIRQLHLDRGRALAHLGDVAGARADLEEALAGARRADDRALEMKALNELGFLLAGAADYRAAVPLLEHSLRLAEGLGDRAGEVNALARLSIIDTNRLRFDRALESGRRALSLARAQKDTESIALALDALEVASVMIGDMTSVDRTARELVEIHRRRGNLWYLQFAIYQWCWVPLAAGRWDEATARVEEAWAINREIGDRGNEAMYPATLCWIARSRGEYGRSLAYGRQGLALAEEVDHAEFTAWSAGVLGWTLLELFANEEASTALSRSLEAADRAGARLELPRALGNLALVRWHEGDLEGAREIALRGDSTLAEVTTPPGRAYLQGADGAIALARTHIEMGELEVAEASLSAVLDAAGSAGWEEVTACAALALAEARVDTDPSLVERALEIATNVGLAGVTWRARTALATGLLTQGRRAEAEREIALSRKAVSALSASIEDENIKRSFRQGATAVIECSREAGDERDGDPPLHDPG
jgi:tetratricopeptide (TPR) repeat protein